MTPQEIQRTIDFILRSQADSVIRMERMEAQRKKWEDKRQKWEEKFEARHALIQREIRSVTREHRQFMKSQWKYGNRLRTLESRDRQTRKQLVGIQTVMRILTRLADVQSKRLDELQRKT